MTKITSSNTHVKSFDTLLTPREIRQKIPTPAEVEEQVVAHRENLRHAMRGQDQRFVIIVGPCSIHDTVAGLDYAKRLADLQQKVADRFLIVMRVYFEKPRTNIGWKGLINDPHLDGSNDIATGLIRARKLLLEINQLGLACATEFLDPIVPQYISDLITWAAIGARTTESQTHREMASGLSMPVGFKNATDGGLDVAANAMISARSSHAFLGIDLDGRTSIVKTTGNQDVHIILRGGLSGPNYQPKALAEAKSQIAYQAPQRTVMIDCSHGNSDKDFRKQPQVFTEVFQQYIKNEPALLGVMLESFLVPGQQSISAKELTYGQSITDGCIDWPTTEELILRAYQTK
ncbi:MAG: 3-deoxy-7-phosphoheptulonate synthase [Oligoflexus sp.]